MDDLLELVIEIVGEIIAHNVRKSRNYKTHSFHRGTTSHHNFRDTHINDTASQKAASDFQDLVGSTTKPLEENLPPVVITTETPSEILDTEYEYDSQKTTNKSKEIRFGVLLLKYVFYQDDLHLSSKEIKQIKKYFKKNASHLSTEDLEAIKSLITVTTSMHQMMEYYQEHNLTPKQFHRTYDQMKDIIGDNPKYNYSLTTIRNTFVGEHLI